MNTTEFYMNTTYENVPSVPLARKGGGVITPLIYIPYKAVIIRFITTLYGTRNTPQHQKSLLFNLCLIYVKIVLGFGLSVSRPTGFERTMQSPKSKISPQIKLTRMI